MTLPAPLRNALALDLRALALFRIVLGLVLLGDLIDRARDLTAFYTDAGVLPRVAVVANPFDPYHVSLHLAHGGLWFQVLLFVIAGAAHLALALGWRTRTAAFVSFVLHASLVARNELTLQGSETVLRAMGFWALWLPIARRWSIDALRHAPAEPPPQTVCLPATAALILQIAYIFFFSALLKTSPDWWQDGTAVYYALHWDELATPFADWMVHAVPEGVLRLLTRAVWVFELVGPLLFVVPWRTGWFRGLGVVLFGFMVANFALSFRLGVWPFAALVTLAPLLPSRWYDALERLAPRGGLRRLFERAPATVRPRTLDGRFARWGAVVALLWLTWHNVGTVWPQYDSPAAMQAVTRAAHLDQRWNMFAPGPRHYGGWWQVRGKLADGSEVFLHPDGAAPDDARPAVPADVFSSHRWRLYMWQYWFRARRPYRRYLIRWLCDTWDGRGDLSLKHVEVRYMKEWSLPGNERPTAEPVVVEKGRCWGF